MHAVRSLKTISMETDLSRNDLRGFSHNHMTHHQVDTIRPREIKKRDASQITCVYLEIVLRVILFV
jgi:hypothetical protein